jgi:2-oxo-4-hydroxy-4-carboxy-5-ureidoimidazoline decarboxylase
MNRVLMHWNGLDMETAVAKILPCCGSQSWAHRMASRRPILDEQALTLVSDEVCRSLGEPDWDEAFRSHPRIGEWDSRTAAATQSRSWSSEEQRGVGTADEDIKALLAEGNRAYERRFGRIFIVCATGKSAAEILDGLRRRLGNDSNREFLEAAEQQRQITQLRLKKWLQS